MGESFAAVVLNGLSSGTDVDMQCQSLLSTFFHVSSLYSHKNIQILGYSFGYISYNCFKNTFSQCKSNNVLLS